MTDYGEIYRRYATDVLRVCYYYLGNREKAEDVMQDVFVKLLQSCPELEEGREKAWLFKVALNRCRDLWRSAWVKRVVLGSPVFELIPDKDRYSLHDDEEALLQTVYRLPPEFKEIILLFYYQNMGISEISQATGVPEGTVSSRLSRARKKLEEMLKDEEAEGKLKDAKAARMDEVKKNA